MLDIYHLKFRMNSLNSVETRSDTYTPCRKRQNMESKAQLTLKEVNLKDLYELLIGMKSSQDDLKEKQESFQKIVQSRISSLEEKLDNKLGSIHEHFKKEIIEVRQEREYRRPDSYENTCRENS